MSVMANDRLAARKPTPVAHWPLPLNRQNTFDGLRLLNAMPPEAVPVSFLDPQYRGILDKMAYGNEGVNRGQLRSSLPQMDEETIAQFIRGIANALTPSGHLFLWMDKFHLCNGLQSWLEGTPLNIVDLITWNKKRMGMGYRTRRFSEHLIVLQKNPVRAKGIWQRHDIPDVWDEAVPRVRSAVDNPTVTHRKPVGLQAALIEAVSDPQDIVLDPAAGSYSVMAAAHDVGRQFLGCDVWSG